MESVDNFQIAIINMLKDSKEYLKTNQMELLETQTQTISKVSDTTRKKKGQGNIRQSKLKYRDKKKKNY